MVADVNMDEEEHEDNEKEEYGDNEEFCDGPRLLYSKLRKTIFYNYFYQQFQQILFHVSPPPPVCKATPPPKVLNDPQYFPPHRAISWVGCWGWSVQCWQGGGWVVICWLGG